MKTKLAKVLKSARYLFIAGAVLGAVIILGVRFITYKHEDIHYHANFAVFINGEREQFNRQAYYQETSMCAAGNTITPTLRAHMHDNANSVIHVEDHAVTWGQFFTNLGWYIGPDFIQNFDGTMYKESDGNRLNLVLNGQDYTGLGGLSNYEIKDKDKLLVSFGNVDSNTVNQEFKSIPSTAAKYDTQKDPASCKGHGPPTISERFKHLF